MRYGGAGSGVASGGHAGAADGIAGDGGIDRPVILLEVAVDEREVGLAHLAARKHLAELEVSSVVAGDDNESAGLFVEAMDDAWAQRAPSGRKLLVVAEKRVHQCAAVAGVFGGSRPGVDHHSSRLVDDGEGGILVDNVER